MSVYLTCTPKYLPAHMIEIAARRAIEQNPLNAPLVDAFSYHLCAMADISEPSPFHLALMTGKNWATGSVLTVAFVESTPADLEKRILDHMNVWGEKANIRFARSDGAPMIRITRGGNGYWSYIGTDLLSISSAEPTMCLEDFTMATPESEFHRVVRHEAGHSLGFPHEHSRPEIIKLLDPEKTIRYFYLTQGWSEAVVRTQILTPIDKWSIQGTPLAQTDSIMCYQFPSYCTVSGQPILGGTDITPDDFAFAAKVYPRGDLPSLALGLHPAEFVA